MDEIERKKVLEVIKQSIDEVVYDEIRQMPARLQAKQEELTKTKSQRAQDAHDALFGRDEDEMSYKLRLHESSENPKITTNELDQFQKEFKNRFPGISFDKQIGPGQNGQIVDFPVKNGQKDAVTSGTITVGKDSIKFSMSLLNGVIIKSAIQGGKLKGFEISKESKDTFDKILNLYEEIFKKKFNEIINPTQDATDVAPTTPEVAPMAASTPPPAAPAPATPAV